MTDHKRLRRTRGLFVILLFMNTSVNLHPELSHAIIGIAIDVHNSYGSAHKEVIYERAFQEKLELHKIPYVNQPKIPVYSVDTKKRLGWYQPDFLISDKIILEMKATKYSVKIHETQLRDYLKVTGYELGYLLNFGMMSLYFRRIIYTNDRKHW